MTTYISSGALVGAALFINSLPIVPPVDTATPVVRMAEEERAFKQISFNTKYATILEFGGNWSRTFDGTYERRQPIGDGAWVVIAGLRRDMTFDDSDDLAEVVLGRGWITVALGGPALSSFGPPTTNSNEGGGSMSADYVYDVSDIVSHQLNGPCWERVAPNPAGCAFRYECTDDSGPTAFECVLTVEFTNDTLEFRGECGSDLSVEECGEEFRITCP